MSRVLRSALLLDRSPQFVRGWLSSEHATAPADSSPEVSAESTDDFGSGGDSGETSALSEALRLLLASVEHSVLEAEQMRRQSLEELQHLAVELAVTIAGELVFRAIDADQFDVGGLVRAAVEQLGLDAPLTVSLNPSDIVLLEKLPTEDPPIWSTRSVALRPDASLPRGHCRATNGATVLLSELAPRLAAIRESLWEGLDDAQIERRQAAGVGSGLKRFPDRRETA